MITDRHSFHKKKDLSLPTDDIRYHDACSIIERLQSSGYYTVLAGGCVRDMVSGQKPKDYDVATAATPAEAEAIFKNTKPVGRRFGVILVILNGCSYEIATFRSESEYSDSRRPDKVHFGGIEEDVERRDFTINGMYYDPVSAKLIDMVGGERDLSKRVLKTIGHPRERFNEDYLRLIRAVRFAARFNLKIENGTEAAVKEMSHKINRVAAERLAEELRIILTDRAPVLALKIMDRLGLLTAVFPEIELTRGCEQPENYHPEGDVFTHTLLTVEKLGEYPDFECAMAALLHDIGKPQACRDNPMKYPEHERIGAEIARKICRRLRLTKKETQRITWLVKRHMYFKDAKKMKKSTLRRLFAEDGFEQLCGLTYADSMASWGCTENIDYVLQQREALKEREWKPQPLVNGYDLMKLGYAPGPELVSALDRIYDLQLEGEVNTQDEALIIARKMIEE